MLLFFSNLICTYKDEHYYNFHFEKLFKKPIELLIEEITKCANFYTSQK